MEEAVSSETFGDGWLVVIHAESAAEAVSHRDSPAL